MLNALKMVVCLNSAVSFDMYSQQFTLCYCLVKSLQKPSSLYSLLKFVYVTSQLSHSLVMQPLLRKILDPPLHLLPAYSSITLNTSLNNLIPWFRLWLDTPADFECLPWYQLHQYVLFQRAEFDAFLYSYARQVLVSKKESYTDWMYVSWSRSISELNSLGWLLEQSLVYFYFSFRDSRSLQICLKGVYFINISTWISSVSLLDAVREIFVWPWKMVSVQI